MAEPDVVVISGASAGVGRATAVAFARRGAKVALLARSADGLAGASREVEEAGGRPLAIVTDVAEAAQVEAAAARVEAELGPIDVWVNSAMVTVFSPIADLTPDEVRRVTEVTYLGTVYGTMAALRRMRARGKGSIVQVGSALAYRSIPLQAAYCGAKFAIRGFTDSLRCELLHNREEIQLTMVQLSAFNTPQFQWARTHIDRHPQPLPPIYQPELAARGIVFAAYSRRREVWVGAPAVKTIIANRIAPWLLDRYLARKAWGGQMLDEPADTGRPDNLFAPLPGDWGGHGRFDHRAKSGSWQLWLTMHPGVTGFSIAALVLAILVLVGAT